MRWSIALAAVALLSFGCDDGSSGAAAGDQDAGVGAGGEGGGSWGGQGGAGGGGSWGADAGAWGGGAGGMGGGAWEGDGGGGGVGGEGGAGGAGGGGNTNIALGGAQDLGYFRALLDANRVPTTEDFDAAGFFAEHHTPLPNPDCGERVCVQAMLGVLGNLINGNNCTMLQLGLNSPIVADPNNRPPLNLVVVIDTSGSMNTANKIGFVRDGLQQLINALRDDDRLALVTFDSQVTLLMEMADLRAARVDAAQRARNLRASGGTRLHDGLELGYREAFRNYDSGRQNRLILLSDGRGSTADAEIIEMSRGYNSDGIGLTTVGLGTDFNVQLMRSLAEQADGNFYFVENAAAVDEVFSQEISYFTVPVAFDLELTLTEGSDYRFVRAQGSSFWTDDADGGSLSVPSVFLAHRVAHDDVEPGGGRRGGGSALLIEMMPRVDAPDEREPGESRVAEINARFREPGSDRIVEMTVPVMYPGMPWELRRQGYFDNRIVEKSFVMLNIFVALEMAVDMFHFERDPAGAVGLLERLIAAVADYEDSANEGMGDVDMQYDIALMEQLRDVIIANAPTPPVVEEDIPEDPWPCD